MNILFNPGIDFENLRSKAEFNLVTSRAIQAASLKAVKENKDTVDLAALKKGELILFIYLKTTSMKKTNWKSVLLYIIRIVELVITGAAGGATSGWIG